MANLNLNKVVLCGRLTADPELKTTASGISVVSFTVAVGRQYKDSKTNEREADFISCVAWRHNADFLEKYFKKGSSICILGSIQVRSYDSENGKRYVTEVVAEELSFVDSKAKGD